MSDIFKFPHCVTKKDGIKVHLCSTYGNLLRISKSFRDENDKKFPFEYEMGVVSPNITRLGNLSKNCVE